MYVYWKFLEDKFLSDEKYDSKSKFNQMLQKFNKFLHKMEKFDRKKKSWFNLHRLNKIINYLGYLDCF